MSDIEKINLEDFDWNITGRSHINTSILTPTGIRLYSHEPYAKSMLAVYLGNYSPEGITSSMTKDLKDGETYDCQVVTITEKYVIAQTYSGQSIFIDIVKEKKDALRLGIGGMDFVIGQTIKTTTRVISGNYYGSVVDNLIGNLKIELFAQIKEETSAYKVKVESVNKGGYIVDLSGIKCFLPGSLAAANKIKDFDAYLGKEIYVMIEGYVEAKDMFVVSYKKYLNKIIDSKIQELDLTKKYSGQVTGTSEFGVFVEWEDVYTGLIHKTEFENGIEIDKFQPGDTVEFYIKEIKDKNRLTLSFNEPLEKNVRLAEIADDIDSGEERVFNSKIKHKRRNGCLVEIPEIASFALIPQDKYNKEMKNKKTGDDILIKIYDVDLIAGKLFAEPL
jgi:ribosomal protein S1